MWDPEKLGWRAAVFAIGCAGLIVHPGGARAQSAPAPIVFAQSVDGSTATEVPADAPKPPAPGAPGSATDAAAGAGSPGWFGWGLPPLRWGGTTTTDIRASQGQDQARRLQQSEIANLRAASYIWQPWFAQVSGGLGLVTSKERGGESAGLSGSQPQQARSSAVTGNGDATLFPVSRFPFNAYFDVSDSRASGELTASDSTSTRFGMRQSYRTLEGNANYSASFNRSTLESSSFGRDTVNALAANMSGRVGGQPFELSGSHTRNARSNTGESTAFSNLFARHSYRPEETDLSVESLASASSSDFRLLSAGVPSDNRSRFAQANTFVTWRPDEDSPLYLSGGARIFQSAIASNAGQTESLTLSGNAAASYALSPQTRVSGSATATQLLTDTASTLLTTQTANASHIGNPAGISGFVYQWNAGANLANQTGTAEGSRQNVGGQLGHNLNRNLTLGSNSQVNFGLGQNVGTTYDTVTASAQTLSHNVNASWRLSRDAATSAYVSALAADSRTSGPNANQFQMINFQASGQLQFSRSSTAAVNLTLQGVRQSTSTTPDAGFNFNSGGNLSYFHARAFNVPRLRYSAVYNINESQFRTRLQGDVNATRERVNQSLEQRLDYNVGRVALQLSMRIAEIEGRRNSMLFFRLGRAFGNF